MLPNYVCVDDEEHNQEYPEQNPVEVLVWVLWYQTHFVSPVHNPYYQDIFTERD